MCRYLAQKLARSGVRNTSVIQGTATNLPLPSSCVDAVISNYCFHHLGAAEKSQALREAMRVLRPGGRLVFADMMFRIGLARRRDRAVIVRFVGRMLRHGPAGLLRLAKNATRILLGRGERPATVQWWHQALLAVGFVDVTARALDHEGGIACARKPVPTRDARSSHSA
jgi:SAM-dependent methyltransferase